jgi:hypothetical protein
MRQRAPSASFASRRCRTIARHAVASSWAQLMRMTSMPFSTSACTSSGRVAASLGIVTMM